MGGIILNAASCGRALWFALFFYAALNSPAQVIKMHGAITLEKLISIQKAEIESRAGVAIEVRANGAGRGLANLCAGQADIALMAGSLRGVAAAMNQDKPGSVDLTGLREFFVSQTKIVFITHPEAGVKALSETQLMAVLIGTITNWSEVGGADQRVRVVLSFPGDGVRVWMQDNLLKDKAFTAQALERRSAGDISIVVAQARGACAVTLEKNVISDVSYVKLDKELELPLALVTKGEPTGDIKKVVEATRALIGDHKVPAGKRL